MSSRLKIQKTIGSAKFEIVVIIIIIIMATTAILAVELNPFWNETTPTEETNGNGTRRLATVYCNSSKGESEICDGTKDCQNGSDEFGCTMMNGTSCPGFRCMRNMAGSQCISLHSVCDGQKDCLNGQDETNCNENCGDGRFRCLQTGNYNTSSTCIDQSQVCDGSTHCANAADEQNCAQWAGWGPWCRHQVGNDVKGCLLLRERHCEHASGDILLNISNCVSWGLNLTSTTKFEDIVRVCSNVTEFNADEVELCAAVKNLTFVDVTKMDPITSPSLKNESLLKDHTRKRHNDQDIGTRRKTATEVTKCSRHVYSIMIACFAIILCFVLGVRAFCVGRQRRTYNVAKQEVDEFPKGADGEPLEENGKRVSTSSAV